MNLFIMFSSWFCVLGEISRALSSSIRRSCWLSEMILVFSVVGLSLSLIMPAELIPVLPSSFCMVIPLLSLPAVPIRWALAPRLMMFFTTSEAPLWLITGTGASGDIRLLVPEMYLSSIKSPITSTFLLLKPFMTER